MRGKNFGWIWAATAVVFFVLLEGLGMLAQPALMANGAVPWRMAPTPTTTMLVIVGCILGALAFTYFFQRVYGRGGWREGLRIGFWAAVMAGVFPDLVMAASLQEGRRLPVEFILLDLALFLVAGLVAAALTGRGTAARGAVA